LLIADGNHKVVCRDTKKVSKVSESHWSVGSENKNELIDTKPKRRNKDTVPWYSRPKTLKRPVPWYSESDFVTYLHTVNKVEEYNRNQVLCLN
jgi:hypothetical protein